jgi:hypothetical protein
MNKKTVLITGSSRGVGPPGCSPTRAGMLSPRSRKRSDQRGASAQRRGHLRCRHGWHKEAALPRRRRREAFVEARRKLSDEDYENCMRAQFA